ncbi:hypothetical protein ACIHCQ_21405 [Streptomyces sp. NPDC052236]
MISEKASDVILRDAARSARAPIAPGELATPGQLTHGPPVQ